MKKLNLLFTALLLMCCVVNAKAVEVTIDGIKYDVITKGKQATVISGDTEYSGDIVIPSEITYNNVTCSVTSIGYVAFRYCYGLTSVTIPNSVTSIGSQAFANCENLTDVYCLATNVPDTRDDWGDYYNPFEGSYPEYMTLHVPAEAINSYKTTAPWSTFGTIVEIANTDIINIPAKAVLVTSNNGTINISCSLEGENVAVYSSNAMFIGSTTIENGCASIESGLSKGDIAIVKIGEKSIKVIID